MATRGDTFGHLQMDWMSTQVLAIALNAHVQILLSSVLSTYLLSLVMTISVRLVCHRAKGGVIPFMLMIPCGMVKVVVQGAHAAHSTIHHGFVNNYLSQLMLIWKSDCAHTMLLITVELLKTLL